MKVKICLEIENKTYGSEMRIISVEPDKIPEHVKKVIYEDYGIDIDMVKGK